MKLWVLIFALLIAPAVSAAPYQLTIAHEPINLTGNTVDKITINGGIPGPVLYFQEGDEAQIDVTNHLKEDTAIHWHGLLLAGVMDGVPGLNGFAGIKPNETFHYRFPLRQSGTYWYHSHSMGQEQDGLYGAMVVKPKGKDPIQAERDYVIMLNDFHEQNSDEILSNLKMHSAYYNHHLPTVGDFFKDVKERGFSAAWQDARDWGQMRMSRADLSDVSGYTFLVNGKTPEQNWTGLFKKGERVRLRFINASAMSFFDVRIPGLTMQVVAADGQNIEPVSVDEFRIGNAETYDVVVTPQAEQAYTIVAEPIDRTGFALATLAPREGMRGEIPTKHRKRSLLTMFDMNMEQMMKDMPDMDMSSDSAMMSGWADADTPEDHTALTYEDLRALTPQPQTKGKYHEMVIRLGGNMERYIWTLNGKKYEDSTPIHLNYGDKIRIRYINETMMAHPMHLHGMFVQLDNGQPPEKMPNKHTVIVPPGQSQDVLLTANEEGEWMFHCHLLYHMLSGMMTQINVAPQGQKAPVMPLAEESPMPMEGHHHAH